MTSVCRSTNWLTLMSVLVYNLISSNSSIEYKIMPFVTREREREGRGYLYQLL